MKCLFSSVASQQVLKKKMISLVLFGPTADSNGKMLSLHRQDFPSKFL